MLTHSADRTRRGRLLQTVGQFHDLERIYSDPMTSSTPLPRSNTMSVLRSRDRLYRATSRRHRDSLSETSHNLDELSVRE